jgi:putative ABC transport system ATP-binding protein
MPSAPVANDDAFMTKLKRQRGRRSDEPRVLGSRTVAPPLDAPRQPPLVSARAVVKTYRTGDVAVEALRGVDIDIPAGQFLAIMGPSGNGKTTLLNCCSGIDDIDGGQVLIAGEDIGAMSDRVRTAHRARTMGFVFQSFNLIPVLTAAENCELPLLAAGSKATPARRRALELLDRVGLSGRATHRPAELSGGEQQRVAIARALVAEPAVIWADEPTGNLDSTTAGSVMELFEEVNAGGQTLVVVTHDPSIGARADRLITVSDGRVVADETGAPTSGQAR